MATIRKANKRKIKRLWTEFIWIIDARRPFGKIHYWRSKQVKRIKFNGKD